MISKQYKYKNELHLHTKPVSICSDFTAEEVIETYDSLGINTIALTNHFFQGYFDRYGKDEALQMYIDEYHKLKKCGESRGIFVVLGMEIRFTENINDYLVYGINEDDVYKSGDMLDLGIDEYYRQFKNDKNVIIQAHPFRDEMVRINPNSIDGMETFNLHPRHNNRTALACRYAKENNLLQTGGSDYHNEGLEYSCITLSKEPITDSYMMAELIKSQDFYLDIWGNIISFNL